MSDIVERLRDAWGDCHCGTAPLLEAATEIERLTEENERLTAQVTGRSGYVFVSTMQEMSDGMTRLTEENERLKAELEGLWKQREIGNTDQFDLPSWAEECRQMKEALRVARES